MTTKGQVLRNKPASLKVGEPVPLTSARQLTDLVGRFSVEDVELVKPGVYRRPCGRLLSARSVSRLSTSAGNFNGKGGRWRSVSLHYFKTRGRVVVVRGFDV